MSSQQVCDEKLRSIGGDQSCYVPFNSYSVYLITGIIEGQFETILLICNSKHLKLDRRCFFIPCSTHNSFNAPPMYFMSCGIFRGGGRYIHKSTHTPILLKVELT